MISKKAVVEKSDEREKGLGKKNMDEVNQRGKFRPEIIVLYCEKCLAAGEALPRGERASSDFKVRFEVLPCSSKVQTPDLMKILEQGADGIEVVGCLDENCRSLVGSARTEKRIAFLRSLLAEVSVGEERLGIKLGNGLAASELVALAESRARAVQGLGVNPLKGERP